MPIQGKQEISLSFSEGEETAYIFPIEDLLKEYNHKILTSAFFPQIYRQPISLRPINVNTGYPILRPMTENEIKSMRADELRGRDWMLLKSVLMDQITPKGIINNMPNIVGAVTIMDVIRELGLKGKVYYKSVGEKTYVILKGYAGQRNNLQGTRYLNTNPQITQLGLAKVSVKDAFKKGFKTSIFIYGGIKVVDAIEMLLQDGELKSSFFSSIVTDIPKIAITSIVTAAVGGVVALTSLPVAAGLGIVLAVGIGTSIILDFFDKKIGLTEKLSEAAETMWRNLKEYWNTSSNNLAHSQVDWDPLQGLVFGGPIVHNQQRTRKGDYFVYTHNTSNIYGC